VLKFGGVKALTKHLHEDHLKLALSLEDPKIEVTPKIIDNTLVLGASAILPKSKEKMKVRMVKAKVTVKKTRLDKATSHLYDLEDTCGPEKALNIDLGLYQMEDY
jgi:16S rRNA U1498 N3-methylase RsmE